jgi:hypothetical protein
VEHINTCEYCRLNLSIIILICQYFFLELVEMWKFVHLMNINRPVALTMPYTRVPLK